MNNPRPKYGMGCRPGLKDYRDLKAAMLHGLLVAPADQPSVVDLTTEMPPTYDQDGIGSCSSNAAAGLFRFNVRKQHLLDVNPSRLFIYYGARAKQGWQSLDCGSVIADNIGLLVDTGAPPEASWPYVPAKFAQQPPDSAYVDAKAHEATIYARVDGMDGIKGCLAAGFPVEFGIPLYENFEAEATWRTGDVPEPSGSLIGGHAMLLTGYNESTRRFRLRNSWGIGWGTGGNGTISYDYVNSLSFDRWTIREVTGPLQPPTDRPTILRAIVKPANRKLKILGSWIVGASFDLDGVHLHGNDWGGGLFVAKQVVPHTGSKLVIINPDGGTSDPYVF